MRFNRILSGAVALCSLGVIGTIVYGEIAGSFPAWLGSLSLLLSAISLVSLFEVNCKVEEDGDIERKCYFGQRVIINDNTIGVFKDYLKDDEVAVIETYDGGIVTVRVENVKPLPGGQL